MVDPLTLMAIGKGMSGLFQSFGARSKRKIAESQASRLQNQIENFQRQDIIDPYAGIQDLSSMVTNPYANLQVATQAAEMQATEADLSLAATLDTLRATGASAGGATSLAQAAARSKQGVSANIERQEAENARLRAQGESRMQQLQMSEAARVQSARAQGKAFVFGQQETRDLTELDRLQAMQSQYSGQAIAYQQAGQQGLGAFIGTVGTLGASYLGGTNPFTGEEIK